MKYPWSPGDISVCAECRSQRQDSPHWQDKDWTDKVRHNTYKYPLIFPTWRCLDTTGPGPRSPASLPWSTRDTDMWRPDHSSWVKVLEIFQQYFIMLRRENVWEERIGEICQGIQVSSEWRDDISENISDKSEEMSIKRGRSWTIRILASTA